MGGKREVSDYERYYKVWCNLQSKKILFWDFTFIDKYGIIKKIMFKKEACQMK